MALDTAPSRDKLLRCITENARGFLAAAMLLGGSEAGLRTARILARARDLSRADRGLRVEAGWLHGLLTLRHNTPRTAACVARLHPNGPEVLTLCLLADMLDEALAATAQRAA